MANVESNNISAEVSTASMDAALPWSSRLSWHTSRDLALTTWRPWNYWLRTDMWPWVQKWVPQYSSICEYYVYIDIIAFVGGFRKLVGDVMILAVVCPRTTNEGLVTFSWKQLAGECPGGWFFRDLWLCHLGGTWGDRSSVRWCQPNRVKGWRLWKDDGLTVRSRFPVANLGFCLHHNQTGCFGSGREVTWKLR